jgi:hypothetical protein
LTTVEEFLDKEAASWEAFDEQVARIAVDRRDSPGVVGDWTVKDVVWHCAYWTRFAADHLVMEDAGGKGPFTDPFDAHPDEHWDALNQQIAEASSAMTWDDVVAGADEARASLRTAVARPGLAAEAIVWAADESWIHYDEHAEHVSAFS